MGILSDFRVSSSNPSFAGGLAGIKYFTRTGGGPGGIQIAANTTGLPQLAGAGVGLQMATPVGTTQTSGSSAVGQLVYPGKSVLSGQMVRLRIAGAASVNSGNCTVTLIASTPPFAFVSGQSPQGPNFTTIAGTGSQSASGAFTIEAAVMLSASGLFSGRYSAMYNGAYHNTGGTTPWVALDNTVSGIDPTSAATFGASFGLFVGASFSVNSVNNFAQLTEFRIID